MSGDDEFAGGLATGRTNRNFGAFSASNQGLGTIGCFVQPCVRWDGHVKNHYATFRGIVTCYHVVRPPNFTAIDNLIHQPAPAGC